MADTTQLIYEIIVRENGSNVTKKIRDDFSKLDQSASNLQETFSRLFLKLAESSLETLIDAGKNFAKFEDTLSHARRTMSLSREETLQLGDALMELSTNFDDTGLRAGVSANELAKISGILGQLGFNARDNQQQFENLVVTVAKVGTAFGMTSAKAAEGLGILKNLYDLPVEKIENAASSIAYLGNTTVATAGQILTFMQRVGGIAGLLGVTASQAAALGATLRESGVSATLAGTSMSQIFSRMATDVDRFGEVLKKGGVSGEMLRLKIESGQATDALKMVLQGLQNIQAREGKIAATQALKDLGLSGVRVQQTLLALSNNLDGLNKNLAASDKAFRENIAVNDAYQAAIDNTAQKWNQFKNIIDVIQKIIGKDLAMAFSDFLEKHLIPFTNHFKNWLETSQGAEAIFGRDGLIASGLEWIGEKLSENEQGFFNFLNTLDSDIPKAVDYIKKKFKEWGDYLDKLLPTANGFLKDMYDLITNIAAAWESTDALITQFRSSLSPLKSILQPIWDISIGISKAMFATAEYTAKLVEIITKLGTLLLEKISPAVAVIADKLGPTIGWAYEGMKQGTKEVGDAIGGLVDKINSATDAIQEMGDVAVYESVLPDMAKSTIALTKDTIALGDTYKAQTGTLKNIYQIGENTFTNLSREVQHYSDVFQNSGWKSNTEVQYYLTQTGEAVGKLGYMYTQTGEEVAKTTQKVKELTDTTQHMQEVIQSSFIPLSEQISALSASQLASLGQPVSAERASQLSSVPQTMFSSEGLINWGQTQRMLAATAGADESQANQAARELINAAKALSEAAKQQEPAVINNISLNGTNVVDDYSMDRLTDEITKRQQTTSSSRFFGGSTR